MDHRTVGSVGEGLEYQPVNGEHMVLHLAAEKGDELFRKDILGKLGDTLNDFRKKSHLLELQFP